MTMGIRKMPEEDWLIIDNKYEEEQELRRYLLETNCDGVMQVLPGTEDACGGPRVHCQLFDETVSVSISISKGESRLHSQ